MTGLQIKDLYLGPTLMPHVVEAALDGQSTVNQAAKELVADGIRLRRAVRHLEAAIDAVRSGKFEEASDQLQLAIDAETMDLSQTSP